MEYSLQIQAAEILTSGFGIWGTVSDVAKLISYILSLIHQPPEVGKFSAPERALFQIAVFDTPGYIHFIHELSKSKSFMVKEHLVSLNIFAKLIKKSPTSLIADLPIIIECVMKALDPRVRFFSPLFPPPPFLFSLLYFPFFVLFSSPPLFSALLLPLPLYCSPSFVLIFFPSLFCASWILLDKYNY